MERQKQSDFITKTRNIADSYAMLMAEIERLSDDWSALYSTLVAEQDFTGENESVIKSGEPETYLNSLTDAIANLQTILTAYDAGIDTNLLRITH